LAKDEENLFGCFTTIAINFNYATYLHCDKTDFRNGMAAVIVFGEFDGGQILLPSIRCRILAKNGDLYFVSSWDLLHGVGRYVGDRYSVVLFFNDNVGTMKSEKQKTK